TVGVPAAARLGRFASHAANLALRSAPLAPARGRATRPTRANVGRLGGIWFWEPDPPILSRPIRFVHGGEGRPLYVFYPPRTILTRGAPARPQRARTGARTRARTGTGPQLPPRPPRGRSRP